MAQKVIGLDVGTREVKAVVLEGGLRTFQVRRYLSAPVPQDLPGEEPRPFSDRLAEALAALSGGEAGVLKADAVYTAVPGSEISTHLVTLPFTDARKIEQALPFELEDQLPFGIEEVVWDHQILGQRDGRTEVLVGVVRRESLRGLIDSLAAAGLDPRTVGFGNLAYQNLFAQGVVKPLTQPEPTEGEEAPAPAAEAVLDIGHASTDLCILEDGQAGFARSFPVAGRSLTVAIAAGEKIDLEEAEDLKIEGRPGDDRLIAALERGLAPLVRGVRASFQSYSARTRRRVARVHLTGGTARLAGLAEHLAKELGCEVVRLDPFPPEAEGGLTPEQKDDPAAGLAMALALRGQGGARAAKVNLRKGEFGFKGDLSYLKGNVSRLAALAAVILVLFGFHVWSRFRLLDMQEEQVDAQLCEVTQTVFGECIRNPDDAISRLRGQKAAASAVPKVSAAEVLAQVSQRLSGVKEAELRELDITGTKVRLQGEAESFDAVAKVVQQLKGYTCFGEVTQGQTRQARGGEGIEFNVDAVMAPECES